MFPQNLELVQDARAAKAYRDELDIVQERANKVDKLEAELQRYRDRMNDIEFYRSRVDELREDNRRVYRTLLTSGLHDLPLFAAVLRTSLHLPTNPYGALALSSVLLRPFPPSVTSLKLSVASLPLSVTIERCFLLFLDPSLALYCYLRNLTLPRPEVHASGRHSQQLHTAFSRIF